MGANVASALHASRHAAGQPDALTPASIGAIPTAAPINAQTAAYQVLASDADKIVTVASSSPVAVTIPASLGIAVGRSFSVVATGTGQVSLVAASGVTLNTPNGLKLRTQFSLVTVIVTASNTYLVIGDTTS